MKSVEVVMSNKIDGLPPPQAPAAAGGRRAESAGADPAGARESADVVSFTDTAQLLKKAEDLLETQPEVDQSRVDSLKASIARGEYAVDAGRVAEQMLQLESILGIGE